jgi:hypothetical protein
MSVWTLGAFHDDFTIWTALGAQSLSPGGWIEEASVFGQ